MQVPFERLIIVYQCKKEIINQMPRTSLRIKTQLARLKNYIYTILPSKISHSQKLFKILGGDRPWRKKRNPFFKKTWSLVPLLSRHKPIFVKWVCMIKKTQNQATRYKARLVVEGFEQTHGINYNETFPPMVEWITIRLIIIMVASLGWKIYHMDVKTSLFKWGNWRKGLTKVATWLCGRAKKRPIEHNIVWP